MKELKLSVSAVCQIPIDPELSMTNKISALVTSSCSNSSTRSIAKSPSATWSALASGVMGSLETNLYEPRIC